MTNEEKEELRKKALFLTNTAYLLADMAHTCVFYADDKLNHIREKALLFNDKEREKAVESYNAANCPFKVGEKVIFTLNRSGIIEKIYADDYGYFSYDIRTIKKDGEPSKIIVHTNTWDKIYKA